MKKTPFTYGQLAESQEFTNRKKDIEHLSKNFEGLINTTVISPRRWGKTSLINKISNDFSRKNDYIVCKFDAFNCRNEEQFYTLFANSILKASVSKWNIFVQEVTKYLSALAPKISMKTDKGFNIEFGIDFKDKAYSFDEILDLPQKIATDKNKKILVCIDEFQTIGEYEESLHFQRKLRAHWQTHQDVCYCLYGSKRHLLLQIFSNYNSPFYKFGDILFIDKIKREDWVAFITKRFSDTGKSISAENAGKIADLMQNHPYYTQQLSQQSWLRSSKMCNEKIINISFNSIVDQLSLLFCNIIDNLTPRQIGFLLAICDGVVSFSSHEVLKKYDLGTSANIKNLKNALLEKDIIDILPKKKIYVQDPVFEFWVKNRYR